MVLTILLWLLIKVYIHQILNLMFDLVPADPKAPLAVAIGGTDVQAVPSYNSVAPVAEGCISTKS
jgi:hypothetical protein